MPGSGEQLSARGRQVKILLRGIKAFGSPRIFLNWLNAPCAELDNRTPLSLLTDEEGLSKIEAVIDGRG